VIDFISNAKAPVVVDLLGPGSSANDTAVNAWEQKWWNNAKDFNASNQLWLVELLGGTSDTYTLRNIKSGTYLDLAGGNANDGSRIVGWEHTNTYNQRWIIRKDGEGMYRIQNLASHTFVDLHNGESANGTQITAWAGSWDSQGPDTFHKQWVFERVSLAGTEIHTLLKAHPNIEQDFKSYQVDGEYMILPQGIWKAIWDSSTLPSRKWRKELFDCDDFAAVYKAAVATWGDGNIRADGVSILCGLMLGRAKPPRVGAHAYNFTISDDKWKVLFFEPQNGSFQADNEYQPYLGYF